MIEDREMAALFEVECEEHLQTLDDGLLRLENDPFDAATLEEVFRAAHTVKGSARMLGALDVEAVAHRFEDILGAARHAPQTLPPALDRMGRSVEAMRLLVREAVSGAPAGITAYEVIAQLNGETLPPLSQAASQDSYGGPHDAFAPTWSASPDLPPDAYPPDTYPLSPSSVEDERLLDERAFAAFVAGMAVNISEEDALPLPDFVASSASEVPPAAHAPLAAAHAPLAEQSRDATEEEVAAPRWGRRITDNVPPLLYASEAASASMPSAPTPPLIARASTPVAPSESGVGEAAVPVVESALRNQTAAPSALTLTSPPDAAPLSTADPESRVVQPGLAETPTLALPAAPLAQPAAKQPMAELPKPESSKPEPPKPPLKTPAPLAGAERARAETMRVDPARLDALMSLAGELSVTTTRLTRGLSELDELAALLEEWGRDARRAGVPDGDVRVARIERLSEAISRMRRVADEDGGRLRAVADEMGEGIRRTRLMPMTTVFNPYARMVRDLAREEGREVRLFVEGGETEADKRALEELKDPLMHIVRNAIAHGIETPEEREARGKPRCGTLMLRARRTASEVIVEVEDDGRGLDADAIRRAALDKGIITPEELSIMAREEIEGLIFAPGFSTKTVVNDVAGRGVGLDAAKTNIERIKGSISIESRPARGCTFRIRLPVALTTTRVLLARVGEHTYALPVDWVDTLRLVAPSEVFRVRGRDAFRLGARTVPLAPLRDLLELPAGPPQSPARPPSRSSARESKVVAPPVAPSQACVVLANGEERLGVFVDALLDEQEVVLKPLGGVLERVRNVAGATILGTGEVCMVLNPSDLLKTARRRAGHLVGGATTQRSEGAGRDEAADDAPATPSLQTLPLPPAPRKTVLLVEDSIITRTQEKRILESAGYEVSVAVDGADAWHKLGGRDFDAVVSDVEMPNMDGLSLAARIREEARYAEMPIILVTSLATEDDRQRGMEVGANAYITKGAFDQDALLDALRRLA